MILTWDRDDEMLVAGSRRIRAWSQVRNELNGLRPNLEKVKRGKSDVFYTTTASGERGVPSMPRPFPIGKWKILGVIPHPDRANDGYLWPFYIATDAWQMLDEWELDSDGVYEKKTSRKVPDYAYGLHFSSSDWTQGCIRVGSESDLRWLVEQVKPGDEFIVT